MQRYFVEKMEDDRFILEGDDRFHIVKVMRMGIGDQIICVSPSGRSAVCEIAEITGEMVAADVVKWNDETTEFPIRVAIASGLPKGDKLEWIIQKGTEMGAHRFIPFSAARSVVKLDEKKSGKKAERWQKIAKEAAEQSHRNILPEVSAPVDFRTLLTESQNYDAKLVAYEEESRIGETSVFSETLAKLKPGDSLLIVFGPEGGLSEGEVNLLKDHGFRLCGLGPRILRTETAPLYALAAISYHLELMR
ncbi:16S rRNA (uracil(1498)-N(3))-methyltransferase [Neobacillus sp. YIM B06451]|uniref:16S rRNA (uracil(1498)-N(3))-methyltransferase n=1 Tax=Neobacillus sp. YIM B06451 TaxID=3070994 RepID=UPI0029308DA1|nr:16S rRNA (uracil(1498)-N(3))-methyltransferase [Neobacillus sp. YIM B06451]